LCEKVLAKYGGEWVGVFYSGKHPKLHFTDENGVEFKITISLSPKCGWPKQAKVISDSVERHFVRPHMSRAVEV
jgi:hypothetical protein